VDLYWREAGLIGGKFSESESHGGKKAPIEVEQQMKDGGVAEKDELSWD
jgi:hypothetical protein